jgi:O-antigen/teichoic acid export membrane protein
MNSLNSTRGNRLMREGVWILLGQMVTVAGSLVLVRVLTEYLSPEQFGELALGLTLANVVNQVVMGGIGGSISRFYSIAAEQADMDGYLNASIRLLMFATGVSLVIGLSICAGLWSVGASEWIGLAAAAVTYSILTGYNSSLNGLQNAARQRAIVAFHGGLDAWIKILLALGLMSLLGMSSAVVVVGYACSSLLVILSQLIFLRHTISKQLTHVGERKQWLRQMWAYSMPFSVWGAFTWAQQVSDRWALEAFSSIEDVGKYAVLFQIGYTPIVLIASLAVNFVGPILYQRSGDGTNRMRNRNVHRLGWKIASISLVLTLFIFSITTFIHEWLLGLLVAAEYRHGSAMLPWLVLAGGLFATGQVLALKLMSELRSAAMTRAKIVTSIIGMVMNLVGCWLAGIQGLVFAMVAFSGLYLLWMAKIASSPPKA